jgi:hypothetical protein
VDESAGRADILSAVFVRFRYQPTPHPHVVIDEIVDPMTYASLVFPDHRISPGDAWGLTAGDAAYADVLGDPGWRAVHDELRGPGFVAAVLGAFGDDLRREGCRTDPRRARLVEYTESREDKERAALADGAGPDEIYTRMDFQSKAAGGYREFVHLDWARRIVGGILFFSDADEEGLEGGELALYRDRAFANDRWCHDPELTATFTPRHNTGVIFLNSNAGFHGPRAITRLTGRRRWLYYTISSKVDVWPAAGAAVR